MEERTMEELMRERKEFEEDYAFVAAIVRLLAETTWDNSPAGEGEINYVYTTNGAHFHKRPLYRDYIPSDPWMNRFSPEYLITDKGYTITKAGKSMEINMGLSRGCLDRHDDEKTDGVKKAIFEEFEKKLRAEGYLYTVL